MDANDNAHDNGGGNRLLSLLPPDERRRLAPHLERVALGMKEILYAPGRPIEHVFFLLSGVGSIVTIMEDGRSAEVGTVGNEGLVGLPVFLGADRTPGEAFSQVPGEALRMSARAFREEVARGGALTAVVHRYTLALFTQIAQSAACNRLHSIEQRCARWLLMTQDRVGADQFPLTQEFLSQMLGVRRATVTQVARALQGAGLIRYSRGRIAVLDRAGLEAASCECYAVIRAEFDRLLS